MGRFSRGFKKKDKREKLDTMKAQALSNYRAAQKKARTQGGVGWGHPDPKVSIKPGRHGGNRVND